MKNLHYPEIVFQDIPVGKRDITGATFTRWTVLGYAGKRGVDHPAPYWFCLCQCGNKRAVALGALRQGVSPSCGCISLEILTKHGGTLRGTVTPEYRSWQCMKDRVLNPNHKAFKNYGGRGVTIAPQWQESFSVFLADMGPRPSPGHSLDRIDNNGNYEPANCRWATKLEQVRNTRKTRYFTYQGRTLSLPEWAAELGIERDLLWMRIVKRGLSFEEAVTMPIVSRRMITFNGKTQCLREWSNELAINYGKLSARLNQHGWTVERALTTP